jgi:NAD(P)-dependent dehydrogenase (short-subunit alcohol dehydrogenase family)
LSAPTALVTGASRGIGKAIALSLAAAGYDVAITARTLHDGDPTSRSPETGEVLPGSLDTTQADITAMGRRCVPLILDLLDGDSLQPCVEAAITGLGHVDVLVNNAIYVGNGNDRRLIGVERADIEKRVWANVTAQILITQAMLRHMVARGTGTIVDITSGAGQATPKRAAGEGGWALVYAATKAGFHRIADMTAVEYGDQGIVAYNVDPGYVNTERVLAVPGLDFVRQHGVAPSVVGDVVAWLVTHPGVVPNGGFIRAQEQAVELGLL